MPTTFCQVYAEHINLPKEIWDNLQINIKHIKEDTGKVFGDETKPFLFSVRSSAAISMTGMMDTVLNIGLNDTTVKGLVKATQNLRFAWDAYCHLLNMFGDVVKGIPHEDFEQRFDAVKSEAGVKVS
jgi:pyruvate,orthophosphate dikinase